MLHLTLSHLRFYQKKKKIVTKVQTLSKKTLSIVLNNSRESTTVALHSYAVILWHEPSDRKNAEQEAGPAQDKCVNFF